MLIGWIMGILAAQHLPSQNLAFVYIPLFCISASLLIWKLHDKIAGVLGILICFVLGHFLHKNYNQIAPTELPQKIVVWISDTPKEKEKSIGVNALVLGDIDGQKLQGGVLIYLQKTDLACGLQRGDILEVNAEWQKIVNDSTTSFKAADYYYPQGIFHRAYLRGTQWKLLQSEILPSAGFLRQVRQGAQKVITGWGLDDHSQQVMQALILGDKSTLDPELRKQYANAGVVHILAVSGLHVGIIYLLISLIFKYTLGGRGWRLQALVTLCALWLYALLTGLSPSVWRAATMFSLLSIAQQTGRITNIYHTLSASAFFLLILDTNLLFSPGFQLSYAAVFGIVRYQPIIASWWEPPKKWLEYIWQLSSVSIAAQIFTLPFSLAYFGQFPTYFLLANLLILPLLSVIMISSIALLLLGAVFPLHQWLIWPVKMMYLWENTVVKWVNTLPGAVITNLDISLLGAIFLGLFFLCGLEAIERKSAVWLKASLASLVVLLLLSSPYFVDGWEKSHLIKSRSTQVHHYKYHGIAVGDDFSQTDVKNLRDVIVFEN